MVRCVQEGKGKHLSNITIPPPKNIRDESSAIIVNYLLGSGCVPEDELDQAVAAAYGWSDLDLGHGFHATKQGERYTLRAFNPAKPGQTRPS